MTRQQCSEARRASRDKAKESVRLLVAADYQGAIAACTEAIELDSGSIGATRNLEEAQKRLESRRRHSAAILGTR